MRECRAHHWSCSPRSHRSCSLLRSCPSDSSTMAHSNVKGVPLNPYHVCCPCTAGSRTTRGPASSPGRNRSPSAAEIRRSSSDHSGGSVRIPTNLRDEWLILETYQQLQEEKKQAEESRKCREGLCTCCVLPRKMNKLRKGGTNSGYVQATAQELIWSDFSVLQSCAQL